MSNRFTLESSDQRNNGQKHISFCEQATKSIYRFSKTTCNLSIIVNSRQGSTPGQSAVILTIRWIIFICKGVFTFSFRNSMQSWLEAFKKVLKVLPETFVRKGVRIKNNPIKKVMSGTVNRNRAFLFLCTSTQCLLLGVLLPENLRTCFEPSV